MYVKKNASLVRKPLNLHVDTKFVVWGAPVALEAYYPYRECPISANTSDLKEKIITRVHMDLLFYHVLCSQRILA